MQIVDSLGSARAHPSILEALVSGRRHTASLVCSPSGEFVDEHGTSKGLGGPVDKQWLISLRRSSAVVLTSGKTFRAEEYRMPKKSDLAVLSKSSVDTQTLNLQPGQRVIQFEHSSYSSAATELVRDGYRRIHIEYGPQGMRSLIESGFEFDLWLSGDSDKAVQLGASHLGVNAQILLRVDGLSIALAY